MKLSKLGYLIQTFLLTFITVMFFIGGAESKDKFIVALSFTVISLLFFLFGSFKWKQEAKNALVATSDALKTFLGYFKFIFLGHLFLLWILFILFCSATPIFDKLLGIKLPAFIVPIIGNVSYLLLVVSVIVCIAYKRYGQVAMGSALYALIQLMNIATKYFSAKELSDFSVINFLIFWTIFGIFSMYAKNEAPVEKVKVAKEKKTKKSKKDIEKDAENEAIEAKNAEVVEKLVKQKESEKQSDTTTTENTGENPEV